MYISQFFNHGIAETFDFPFNQIKTPIARREDKIGNKISRIIPQMAETDNGLQLLRNAIGTFARSLRYSAVDQKCSPETRQRNQTAQGMEFL